MTLFIKKLCERIALVKDTLVEIFFSTSLAEFQTIRYQILTFLQDLHVRISMFLKTGVQKQTGEYRSRATEDGWTS